MLELFLELLLEDWNGNKYRNEILKVMSYLSLQPFDSEQWEEEMMVLYNYYALVGRAAKAYSSCSVCLSVCVCVCQYVFHTYFSAMAETKH